ncbi:MULTISPECIES: hypothetical protein [unclassified Burkholderia]|uniref:hypothetical protein n=1 Tax=unclassified Burkholderia TaxID=2613784 RepID=UPI002AB1180F|nr:MULTISPECIES: hypothetical protein [unclassified Burkholderia]
MNTTYVIRQTLDFAVARVVLREAWFGGKNRDNPHARWIAPTDDGKPWVIADVPLAWIRPNEAGVLYDGTVNLERARAYAAAMPRIDVPVYLAFGPRMVAKGRTVAAVHDGGHRVTAARMRGDSMLHAIMRRRDLEQLASAHMALVQR